MASTRAKAQLLDTSLKRLKTAMEQIASATGIEAVEVPTSNRDPELLVAYQVEAFANWAEKLADNLKKPAKKSKKTNETPDKPLQWLMDGLASLDGQDGVELKKDSDGNILKAYILGVDAPDSRYYIDLKAELATAGATEQPPTNGEIEDPSVTPEKAPGDEDTDEVDATVHDAAEGDTEKVAASASPESKSK